ncbi:signal peptidase I [Kineococcus gynurae]|uniref:Signal peptidase I n=1 Tax=Kineococcus gynurae TaxID=452979 RepID=A0ABV5LP34_9ACTN
MRERAGAAATEPPAGRSVGRRVVRGVREVVLTVAIALTVSLLVKTFLFQPFFIPSESMEDTLVRGDRVVVGKFTPGLVDLRHGDVVVFEDPGNWLSGLAPEEFAPPRSAVSEALAFVGLAPSADEGHLVKRVVGLPGDRIACPDAEGPVQRNGVELDESAYLKPGVEPCGMVFDVTVPAGQLWVMGDNRARSRDSRYHQADDTGPFVPLDRVTGRAYVVVWPLSDLAWLGR